MLKYDSSYVAVAIWLGIEANRSPRKKNLIKSRWFNLFIDQRMPLQDVLDANSECLKSRTTSGLFHWKRVTQKSTQHLTCHMLTWACLEVQHDGYRVFHLFGPPNLKISNVLISKYKRRSSPAETDIHYDYAYLGELQRSIDPPLNCIEIFITLIIFIYSSTSGWFT